jgi:3-dehydroshikimate dehydratase
MFIISAFADEISPEPQKQIDVLKSCDVRHIEFRSILGTNVLALSDLQIKEFKALLDANGFRLSAIGSPIGKIRIDEPFEPHLEKLRRAIKLAQLFETPNIRVFSFYPAQDGADWAPWRDEVLSRMTRLCELAEESGVWLMHENEHRIYGDRVDRVLDLQATLGPLYGQTGFGLVYDPANYVFCGYDPWDAWTKTREYTRHFHIKDWKKGEEHGSIPGQGQGRIPEVIAEAVRMGYDGFATMEPHLLGGGPTGGVTGPELFPKAVAAFKQILEQAGASYR